MRTTDTLVAYYGHLDWPSNFFLASFQIDNLRFNCVEKAYMYFKALYFGDSFYAAKILAASEPYVCKSLGSRVRFFDENLWDLECEQAMMKAMEARFRQNPTDLQRLLNTKNKILVEASKRDRRWGCGFSVFDDRIDDPQNWTGLNLHGKCLMALRKKFQEEQTELKV